MLKLVPGGVIDNDNLFMIGEKGKPLIDIYGRKYLNIYNRTKTRRIKKKQLKRCPQIEMIIIFQNQIKNLIRKSKFEISVNNKGE